MSNLTAKKVLTNSFFIFYLMWHSMNVAHVFLSCLARLVYISSNNFITLHVLEFNVLAVTKCFTQVASLETLINQLNQVYLKKLNYKNAE